MSKLTKEIKKTLKASTKDECVKVVIRARPLIHQKEKEDGRICCIFQKKNQISITNPENTNVQKSFTYDKLFQPNSTQVQVYTDTAQPIVESVLCGYNGTVIAYGQTGAGKTFTMEGSKELPGLIPQCFKQIFDFVNKESKDKKFLVQCSMVQIYKEETFDLLGKNPKKILKVRENPKTKEFYVENIVKHVVNSAKQIQEIMERGQKNRTVHATPMNPGSSRSHCIFQVRIETFEKYPDGKEHVRVGKLQLVDLAGSERAKKTGGVRQTEMIKINWGLTCLGNVIMSLTQTKNKHVPYRDSKLTKLLSDSLGGNTKTVLVANISPSSYNYNETLGTLRYASRAKSIKNKPIVNEDPKDALIRQFQEQIELLKSKLQNGDGLQVDVVNVGKIDENVLLEMKKKNEEEKKKILEEMKENSEEEKKKLINKQKRIEKKRKEIENKLKNHRKLLEKEREKQLGLRDKLKKYEAQIVLGGKIKSENETFKRELEDHRKEIERRKVDELRLRRTMEKRAEHEQLLKEEFLSTKDEIRVKTKKLKRIYQKLKQVQEDFDDCIGNFQHEREEYLFAIKNLEKENKYKEVLITSFIPPEEVEKIKSRMIWNEEQEEFDLKNIELFSGNKYRRISAFGTGRPKTRYALEKNEARFKEKNVLDHEYGFDDENFEDDDDDKEEFIENFEDDDDEKEEFMYYD